MIHGDESVDELCRKLLCRLLCAPPAITRIVTYKFNGVSFTAKGDKMGLTVSSAEVPGTVSVSVSYVDAKGKPAKVDGVPIWSASDPAIVDSVTPSADGMSAEVHITDEVGASQLSVTADVDLGEGVKSLESVDTISVMAAEAVAANFTFGAVSPDP